MKKIFFKKGDKVPTLVGGCLLLGYFDGVHRGHFELIKTAKREKNIVGVLLFDENLGHFLPNTKSGKELTTLEEKLNLFENYGIDAAYIVHTDENFLKLRKEEFISQILENIKPDKIIVGTDYTFGYKKEGSIEDLKKRFDVIACPLLEDEFGKISTRTIISLLEDGKVECANSQLGYLYSLSGKVFHGLENGRKISYPTANISIEKDKVKPKVGVYAGYTEVDNKKYESIINIGSNPTIGKLHSDIIETHILNGFKEDIYNKDIRVYFLDYIRDEKKFSSLDELKNQLDYDSKYFERNK